MTTLDVSNREWTRMDASFQNEILKVRDLIQKSIFIRVHSRFKIPSMIVGLSPAVRASVMAHSVMKFAHVSNSIVRSHS